jgi:dolichol-phosphate mannosyltransferase
MDEARGDAVVIIDADLQDPPEVIADMLAEYRQGYDVVYGKRTSREGEAAFKRLTAWAFYRLMRRLIHPDLPADVGDFRLISRSCLDAVKSMSETHRFLRGMITWVGFPQTAVTYARSARVAGETKYPISKMLRLAWTAAVSFSPKPLRVSFLLGFMVAARNGASGERRDPQHPRPIRVPGWSSLIVVTCLTGGAILISIGVLGEYVGRIFEASKERPIYLIASRVEPEPVAVQMAALAHMGAEHDR